MTIIKWRWRSAGPLSCHFARMGYFEATVRRERGEADWEWAVDQVSWPDVEPNNWDDAYFAEEPEPYAMGLRGSERDAKHIAEQALRDAHEAKPRDRSRYLDHLAAERERCARVIEDYAATLTRTESNQHGFGWLEYAAGLIRKLGNEPK